MEEATITWANNAQSKTLRSVARALLAIVVFGPSGFAETGTTNFITGGINTNAGATFIVGNSGPFNYLEINSASSVSNGVGIVGNQIGASNNTVFVTGGGSVWTNVGRLTIGETGSVNQLIVTNGAVVRSTQGVIGNIGTDNSVLVTGNNSLWNISSFLDMGLGGGGLPTIATVNNQLTISAGGRVNVGDAYVGDNQGASNNIVLVTGAGSLLNVTGSDALYIGYKGWGNQLIVTNGGQVRSIVATIGRGPGSFTGSSSNNSVTITGNGSIWPNTSTFP